VRSFNWTLTTWGLVPLGKNRAELDCHTSVRSACLMVSVNTVSKPYRETSKREAPVSPKSLFKKSRYHFTFTHAQNIKLRNSFGYIWLEQLIMSIKKVKTSLNTKGIKYLQEKILLDLLNLDFIIALNVCIIWILCECFLVNQYPEIYRAPFRWRMECNIVVTRYHFTITHKTRTCAQNYTGWLRSKVQHVKLDVFYIL